MVCATSGVNSLAGELITPGSLFLVGGVNDVSEMSYANFNFFKNYTGGLRGLNVGDVDNDGNLNFYLAGHYDEALYDWEFNGGDPLEIESYTERVVFMDDTTDNFTPGNDQGKLRIAKVFSGDIDNDGLGDIVFSSGSFAPDKPHLFMVEYEETLDIIKTKNTTPGVITISQNFPNPFNPETTFNYTVHKTGKVLFSIYNVMGDLVYTVDNRTLFPGSYNIVWNGVNNFNRPVSSGIYFYQLKSGEEVKSGKMVYSK